jgi:hypothetical protein
LITKGNVVASLRDPFDPDFYCGTAWNISNGTCIIWTVGGGMSAIATKNVVLLRDVLSDHPDAPIVAEKDQLLQSRIFMGGVIVERKSMRGDQYQIRAPSGVASFIAHTNSMHACDALRILEPCPRSRNR